MNTRYFDLVSLHLEVGIDRELLIGYFKLEKDRFDTFIRLYNTFIDSWLTSVELREGVDYYLKGSEERFFLEKSNSITQRGLTKDNFDKLRFENFFPEILSEDENFWILRWQQRLP